MAAAHYFIAEDWGRKISFGGSAIHSQIIHSMPVIPALLLRSISVVSGAGNWSLKHWHTQWLFPAVRLNWRSCHVLNTSLVTFLCTQMPAAITGMLGKWRKCGTYSQMKCESQPSLSSGPVKDYVGDQYFQSHLPLWRVGFCSTWRLISAQC